MLAVLLFLAQGDGWTAAPPRPTVGDTVWLERRVSAPVGWRVRAGRLEGTPNVQSLGDPSVRVVEGGWLVRYAVAAWAPGAHLVALPVLWRLAPDGRADSLPGGVVRVDVSSVIPDGLAEPEPRPALVPLRRNPRRPLAPLGAAILAAAVLAGGIRWRRRPPRVRPPATRARPSPPAADEHWLAAGEAKAVAARAAGRLRLALARAVPGVGPALSTAECLALVEQGAPHAPLPALGELLPALDRALFEAAAPGDVAMLAARARALAVEIAP